MKSTLRTFTTSLCSLALACSFAFPSFSGTAFAQASAKSPRADVASAIAKGGRIESAEKEVDAPVAPYDAPEVASNYVFATATNGSLNDMSTGTTQLLAANLDDTASALTGIGFDFFFQGVRHSQFSINDNGVLRLGASAQTGSPYKPLAQSGLAIITAYGADQRTHLGDGKVHFKVTGTAPTRVLTVEWLNNQANFNTGGTADLTYQVRLYETTGVIEYVYGSMTMSTAGAADANSKDPNIGFSSSNAAGTVGSVTAPQSGTPDPTFNGASATPVANLYTAGPITTLTSAAQGSRRVFSFTPPATTAPTNLTFTNVTALGMTLNWTDSPDEASYAIYRSTDGVNFVYDGAAAQNATSYAASGLSFSTTYSWQVYAISEGALSSALAGSQMTSAPGNLVSVQSGNWSDPNTWGGSAPTAGDNVTVANGHTVEIDSSNALNVTVQNGGILQFEATTARTLTVGQSVTIDLGGTFRSNPTGTQVGHLLSVGTNLTNNGTLDFSTNGNTAGAGITFVGAASNTFGGTGATTNLRTLAINKGTSNANALELNPSSLTVQGVATDVAGFLTLTNGTLKVSGTFALTNRVFTAAGYTIGATAGFWLNNPNFVVAGQNGSPAVSGLLRISSGTLNIGTATGNSMAFNTNSTILVEGGAVNAAGRFGTAAATTVINYTQSAGTVTVCTVGNASTTLGSFDLGTSLTSNISLTGGNIICQLAATTIDYRNQAGSGIAGVTGATLRLGNAASGAAKVFSIRGVVPNLVVDSTSAGHSASWSTTITNFNNISLDVTVGAGATLNFANAVFLFNGATLTNNGTITHNGASSRFIWFNPTLPGNYTGTGVVTAPMTSWELQTPSVTMNSSVANIVVARIIVFVGDMINSNKLTLGNGGATTGVVQIGNTTTPTAAGTFDVPLTFNLGTGGETVSYLRTTSSRTTGGEINPARTLTSMTRDENDLNNTLTLSGGDLTLSSAAAALTLTNGRVLTGSNTLTLSSGTATVARTAGYVEGNFRKTFAAAATKNFEVGTANGYSPVSVNGTAGTFPTTFTAKAVQGQAPYASSPNSLQRFWTLTNGALSSANLTFTYLAPDVVGTVANYQFLKNDMGTITVLPPTGTPTATSAVINGVTSFSDWTLGEPSANADLSSLVPSVGTLSPTFDPATTSYTDAVSFDTTSITITPTKADANATITVNGNPVVSGMPSGAISLAVGSNVITTTVTAQDGTMKSYSVDVMRAAASMNADLSNLTLSDGTLTPAFDSGMTDYTASVPNSTSSMTVTPTAADAASTIMVNGNAVASGMASGAIALMVGPNAITTVVTAQDGTTMKTYTVTVTRASAVSSNADLSNLVPSVGTLSPTFDPGTFAYTESVSSGTTSMTVTPTAADANATIAVRINGGAYTPVASGMASASLPLNVGANTIDTRVTAQDATTVQTYTITVTRAGNVNVNPGAGSYATLKAAFDAINAGTHTGAITVDIAGDTVETASASLNASGTGSASYTSVMITPTGARTVSGAIAAGSALVNLAGANNVTIDGLGTGGNSLILSNTTASATASTSTIRFINGASNNAVRNSTILGSSTSAVATAGGTVFFSTSTVAGGNSNNTVELNNIGPAGANFPTKAVLALGSTSPNGNSGNVVHNNNIYDFFSPTVSVAGISLQANTTTMTVSNNRIFQTAPRTFTGASLSYTGISGAIGTGAGTATISGNTIGFGAADGTGLTTISGSTNTFAGISFGSASTTVPTSIQNNTISGISHTTAGDAVVVFSGIFFGGGRYNVGTVTGNKVGSLDGSSTINFTLTSNGAVYCIRDGNTTAISNTIANNEIGALTIGGSGAGGNGFRGILAGGTATGATVTVMNNQVGGPGAGAITDSLVGGYAMYGIQTSAHNGLVTGNTVRNISGNSNGAGLIVNCGIIVGSSSTGVNTIAQNVVHSMSNNSGAASNALRGIQCTLPATANIVERNFVHSLSMTSTSITASADGIVHGSVGTATYRNNMVRLGLDAAGAAVNGGTGFNGILEQAGTNSFYANSVYIGGSGVTSTPNTFAFNSAVITNGRNYLDNIFWNARSNASGTGKNYAISVGGTTLNPPGLTSNYNDLYATGTAGFVGLFNSVDQPTLADWQAATGQDVNSISADPFFVAPDGTAATVDLHLACGSPAIDRGIAILAVTNDFDGDPRGNPPDIGADETNLIGPAPLSAVSRKTHGAAGDFDVDLPFAGPVGIEPRSGGAMSDYQIVVTFASPVNVGGVSITSGIAAFSSTSGNGTNTITINLTGVANAQYLTLTLSCVDDGVNLGNVPVTMGILVGDVNASSGVTGSDVSSVKGSAGQPVTSMNFRNDVVANGTITASDIGQVKALSGTGLPPVAGEMPFSNKQ